MIGPRLVVQVQLLERCGVPNGCWDSENVEGVSVEEHDRSGSVEMWIMAKLPGYRE